MRNIASEIGQKPTAVSSVLRAVKILVCLGNGINAVTDIANCCNLTKPTVYRLLKTLEESLLVTQDPITHRYYLGPLINQIASNPQTTHHYLIMCALEELKHLWDFAGETVELSIMVGIQYVRLHEIPSKHNLKVIEGPDPVGPVYVGASAKVLLSQLNDEELKIVMKSIEIRRITEYSVIDKEILTAQSKKVRQQGYAISYGERIAGALCISAPVKNYSWPVALSVIAPEIRLKPRVDEMVKEVTASARRITSNIAEFSKQRG